MGAVRYLYVRTFVNRVRKALRRPGTYVHLVILGFYIFALPFSLKMVTEQAGMDSPQGMAAVLTVYALWVIPANLIAYARRKGLVYRKSDVHFLFPSPVSPKSVLLYAHLKTLTLQLMLNLCVLVFGRMTFSVELWRLCLYFLFSVVVHNLLEGSIMMLLYGSEKLGERQRGMVVKATYGLAGLLVLMALYACLKEGFSWQMLKDFLHSDMVQLVPVAGWYGAVVHLLFTEPTTVNLICTGAYVLLLVVLAAAAWRMNCTGAYYEDAIKFSEDYEEILESRRQGSMGKRPGRRQKVRKAGVRWGGKGAAALFYRQLLEYKKSRFFIFDGGSLASAIAGVGLAWLPIGENSFVLPGASVYVIFIFTALTGKWRKELKSPYTYLIPDTAFRKLLFATAIQHVQGLVNACLFILPGAVAMGLAPDITLLCLLFFVLFSANKLYALAMAEAAGGSTLGRTGKQFLQMLFQSVAIMAAVAGAWAGFAAGGIRAAHVLMNVCLGLVTLIFMIIAMMNFYKMETA